VFPEENLWQGVNIMLHFTKSGQENKNINYKKKEWPGISTTHIMLQPIG
jgi:hypothetical protein